MKFTLASKSRRRPQQVCTAVEIQTPPAERIAARTWIGLKTVWKEGIVARTWIELESVCEEGSVAFVRQVWLKTDRRRGATHPHVE
ncbi:hypothetical protein GCK32_001326 [Trichostrongylus colubriformis]|uniref:Uncharacterized protein n=1 Tax=Trichostrongylus colubriformis TaxID=6319 RepID=A0AAN8EUC8_TRICO